MSKRLDYFSDVAPESGEPGAEGIRSAGALWSMVASLAGTCAAIGVSLVEVSPMVRRGVLVAVALAGASGGVMGLLALRHRISQVDRTLVMCGVVLGGMSVGAAVMLF